MQKSCVSSSGLLLYRWDFVWDFASERQAAALGGEEGSAGAAYGKAAGCALTGKKSLVKETK